MTWLRLDARELASAGLVLKNTSEALVGANARLYAARFTPGLGIAQAQVHERFQAVGERILAAAEVSVRGAIDVLQRAIAVVREQNAAGVVGSIGAMPALAAGQPAVPPGYQRKVSIEGTVYYEPIAQAGPVATGGGGGRAALPHGTFMDLMNARSRTMDLILEPSKSEVERKLGRSMSSSEYRDRGYRGNDGGLPTYRPSLGWVQDAVAREKVNWSNPNEAALHIVKMDIARRMATKFA